MHTRPPPPGPHCFLTGRLYHHVPNPSQLPEKATFYLFRDGIQPAWEDEANLGGGIWSVQFPRERTAGKIGKHWCNLMLSAIGETLDVPFPAGARPVSSLEQSPSVVAGVALAARNNFYRLSVWTLAPPDANKSADDPVQRLGQRTYDVGLNFKVNALGFGLEDKLSTGLGSEVEFQTHEDAGRSKGRGGKGKVSV